MSDLSKGFGDDDAERDPRLSAPFTGPLLHGNVPVLDPIRPTEEYRVNLVKQKCQPMGDGKAVLWAIRPLAAPFGLQHKSTEPNPVPEKG